MKSFQPAAIAAAALVAFPTLAATHYTVTELPHVRVSADGADDVSAAGIDGKGRAYINVGGYLNGVQRMFGERCSDQAGCKQLPPKDMDVWWRSVAGDRVGGIVTDAEGMLWAARMNGGGDLELLLQMSVISGITKSGLAAGYQFSGPAKPFVYDTQVQWLPPMGEGLPARANAINGKGLVVGEAEHPQRHNSCAVSWKGGVLKVLSCPPQGEDSNAYGVNSLGDVVGASGHVKANKPHAVRFEAGKVIDLGALGDPKNNYSSATAINDSRVAVGYGSTPTDGMPNAVVFDPTEGALEMATLVPQADGAKYYFQYPQSINNAGQILVRATRRADLRQVVLRLDPVPAAR